MLPRSLSTDKCDVRVKFYCIFNRYTPRSLTLSSVFIILPYRLKELLLLIAIALNLSGFAFIWFEVNQSIRLRLSFSRVFII